MPVESAYPSPIVERGTCYCMFAYDIGAAIDLEQAQKLAHEPSVRDTLKRTRSAPKYFDFHPSPVRVALPAESIPLANFKTHPRLDCVIYDFGAVSISYAIDITGPVSNLAELSETLYRHEELAADSRRHVERLLGRIGHAVTKANLTQLSEDYIIYHIASLAPQQSPEQFLKAHSMQLAQILRSERKALSHQEVDDALDTRISYNPDDLAVIDWQAAMLLGQDVEDVQLVLEFANVELLEMRFLDDQLDRVLDTFYKSLSQQKWKPPLRLHAGSAELRRLGRLQMESAVLFEEVNNALKLLGDQFLARVYRLAANRLHIPEWDAIILRKLETVESLYSKLSDFQNTRRMEILEWIIILLIAVSILLVFIPVGSH